MFIKAIFLPINLIQYILEILLQDLAFLLIASKKLKKLFSRSPEPKINNRRPFTYQHTY